MTEYRVKLIYPDGSARSGGVYVSRTKLDRAMHAIARKPGVRYCCEEWSIATSPDFPTPVKAVRVYDI